MSDYHYNVDPVFLDASDFIECNVCESLFDHNEYNSETCSRCESAECWECEERMMKRECPTETCKEHFTCGNCGMDIHRGEIEE